MRPAFYIFGLFFYFSFQMFYSQIIWTETFSNGCSSGCLATGYGGWTQSATGTNAAGANEWFVSGAECGNSTGSCGSSCGGTDPSLHVGNIATSCNGCLYCPSGDCGAAYDAGGGFCFCGSATTTNKRIQSPVINCSGFSNILVKFNFIHNGQPGKDEASFCYFDGTTWTTLGIFPVTNTASCGGQGRWTQYIIALPASANNNPNVRIGFNWKNDNDGAGSDPSFAVDDITVYAKQNFCYEQSLVSYTNAGCTANCVLTEFTGAGPFCNGTSSSCGSCPATGPTLSLAFSIPSGCSSTLSASFERRCNGIGCSQCTYSCNGMNSSNGCCNSGLDVNDYLRIGGNMPPVSISGLDLSPGYTTSCPSGSTSSTTISISGSTITATGNNNGGAILFYSQVGGNVFIETRANRMDEIVTYSLAVSPTCNCSDVVLPLNIIGFWAEKTSDNINLSWMVKEDKEIKDYYLYYSPDGMHYTFLTSLPSKKTSGEAVLYTTSDVNNYFSSVLYYKLEARSEYAEPKIFIRDLVLKTWISPIHWMFDEEGNLKINSHLNSRPVYLSLYSIEGKQLGNYLLSHDEDEISIPSHITGNHGLLLLSVSYENKNEFIKIHH